MRSFHDYYINGYEVDGRNRTLELRLARPEDRQAQHVAVQVRFSQVEGYLLEHDLLVNIVMDVSEEPLDEFVSRNRVVFSQESKWGWPLFWRRDSDTTVSWLKERGSRVWVISSSYGMSGWVVAQEAVAHEK